MEPKPQQQAAPAQPAPVRMPHPDDDDVQAARKKSIMDMLNKRRGRQSTDYTGQTGQDYARTTLG